MTFEESKAAIAQIHYADTSAIAGTGFLVAPGYVLTCAHVVKTALARTPGTGTTNLIGATVPLTFFGETTVHYTEVIAYALDETTYGDDAAVLHLPVSLPPTIQPMPLVSLRQYNDVEVKSFGFAQGEASGLNLTAITEGQINGGWVQLRSPGVTGAAVEEGASGSPVWCPIAHGVVGMMVARDARRETARIGFLIPTERLETARREIIRHSLEKILVEHQQALSRQIATAYQVCRSLRWTEPFPTGLNAILCDLAEMPSEEQDEPKLVQFAACLLNQPQIDAIKTALTTWIAAHTADLGALLTAMSARQKLRSLQSTTPAQPHLFISIQADKATTSEPYRAGASLSLPCFQRTTVVIDWNDNTNRSTFREALQNAYPSEEALELFVDEELNENLAAIAQGNLQTLVFGLIKWARSKGRLDEVYEAFKRQNPKHPVIEALEQRVVVSPNSNLRGGEGDRLQTSPPPSPPQTETTPANLAPEVFVSYAWGGESEQIVNQLDQAFQQRGITLVRDKRDLGFKGRIKAFMEQIGRGKAVVVVISEKYLKSENCMFELVQIAENGAFYDRIFPIVLSDANIYKPVQRIRYVKYWEDQIAELDEAIKTVGAANLQGIRDDIDSYTKIRATIAELTNTLKDMNTLTPEMHAESGFEHIFEAIATKLTS